MRTRTTNNDTETITCREYEKSLLTGTTHYTLITPSVPKAMGSAARMEDVVTPQFHQRVASGQIVMNAMERFSSQIIATDIPKHYTVRVEKDGPNWVTESYNYGWADAPWSARKNAPRTPIPLMTSLERAAELNLYGSPEAKGQAVLASALEKASGSDALALVTIAELDKTIDLVNQLAHTSAKAASFLESLGPTTVRRLNRVMSRVASYGYNKPGGYKRMKRDVGKSLAAIASTWLGYRYGVMATYYDISSWVAAVKDTKRARVTASVADSYSNDTGWVLQNTNEYRDYYNRTSRKRSSVVRAGALVDTSLFNKGDRLGVNRVLTSAWELLPYSFVLDWFVDVGTRIAAWEGDLFMQPLGSWLTYDHVLYYSYSYDYRYQSVNKIVSGKRYNTSGQNTGTVSETCLWRKRVPNPSLSILPSFKFNLNGKRILDGLSLLTVSARRTKSAIGSG